MPVSPAIPRHYRVSAAPLLAVSTECFLTTHTGSLPRPPDLIRMMFAKEAGSAPPECG